MAEAPFALSLRQGNALRLHDLNPAAERAGLSRGMSHADARAFCPGLISRPADPAGDARFLRALARWATRWCPWVGLEAPDGLVLDVTGATHLWGGEGPMLADMRQRFARAGLSLRLGLADTRGAAWALAHGGEGVAAPGETAAALAPLPVAALRLPPEMAITAERLGLRSIGDLAALPRAALARRFGPEMMRRLDQATGALAEDISPLPEAPRFALRLTLPEPIGLADDVMAGAERLLVPLCARLAAQDLGARVLRLTLRRVDQAAQQVELRLAAPMRDARRILPLFRRGVEEADAGFGIDQLRLEALDLAALGARQTGPGGALPQADLEDLITRIGHRITLDAITRFLPAESHIPERAFQIAPAAFSAPGQGWATPRPRPIRLFAPEPIEATGATPPRRFRWRRMQMTTARATGPERIAPEWWLPDDHWERGLRDYWRIETREGRRLWLYHTPQNPGWFVQGEFA